MQQEKIKQIYKNKLLSKEALLNKNDVQFKYIITYLPQRQDAIILDAGCGNGNYAFALSGMGYNNIFAIDLFTEINTDKFIYKQLSIDNTDFYNQEFDFIYSNSVVYYLDSPESAIVEFKRILKDKGFLMFTAHTKYSLFTLIRVIKRDILKLKSMEHLEGVKFYSANYYKKILEKNNFEIILQDGYETSFFLYPLYSKIAKGFKKYFKIKLPLIKPYINSGLIGKIKSEISYHSVFVVIKK